MSAVRTERLVMRADEVTIRPATEAELAFGKVAKAEGWDESQHPRDEDGRFASGVGREDQLGIPPAHAALHDAAFRWSGGGQWTGAAPYSFKEIRDYLAKGYAHGEGSSVGDAIEADAKALVRAVDSAPPTSLPLFRGIGLDADVLPQFEATFKPGAQVDLNLAGWTQDSEVAAKFAGNYFHTQDEPWMDQGGKPDAQVIFQLAPGASAINISDDIYQQGFNEWLSAGRYEVASTVSAPGQDNYEVVLRQVATLNPDQLIGAKVEQLAEPPRFLPWLEAYFEQRMVPPKESK